MLPDGEGHRKAGHTNWSKGTDYLRKLPPLIALMQRTLVAHQFALECLQAPWKEHTQRRTA